MERSTSNRASITNFIFHTPLEHFSFVTIIKFSSNTVEVFSKAIEKNLSLPH